MGLELILAAGAVLYFLLGIIVVALYYRVTNQVFSVDDNGMLLIAFWPVFASMLLCLRIVSSIMKIFKVEVTDVVFGGSQEPEQGEVVEVSSDESQSNRFDMLDMEGEIK